MEKQWSNLDVEGDDKRSVKDEASLAQLKATVPSLSWSDYQFKILPFDARDTKTCAVHISSLVPPAGHDEPC